MKRFIATLIAGLALGSATTALAWQPYEAEPMFSYWGSGANIIARPANWYVDQPTTAVEVECNNAWGSTHLLMTTDEAHDFAREVERARYMADLP